MISHVFRFASAATILSDLSRSRFSRAAAGIDGRVSNPR